MRRDVELAICKYLRDTGWKSTSATPGAYWMWEKTVTDIAYYKGDERHNRTWLVLEDDDLAWCRERVSRAQSGEPDEYADTHPPQVAIEAMILDAMEPMSEDERYSVLALASDFIEN